MWRILREIVTRDAWMKIVALVGAAFVWYATNVLERDAERVVEIPLLADQVPTDVVVTKWPEAQVLATLRGPRPLLDGIDESRTRLVVPLAALEAGETLIDLKTGRFEPELPRRLDVVRLQPGRVAIAADPMRARRIAVGVETVGDPPEGFRVVRTTVEPARVAVSGPARQVDDLDEARTVAIDLHDATEPFTRRVLLRWAGDFVTFEPEHVTVRVEVEEVLVTKEFSNVAVRLVAPPGAKLEPPTVALTLRGPQRLMKTFSFPAGAAYVQVDALQPQEEQLVEVQVDLPAPFEVVTRRPDLHRVTLEAAGPPADEASEGAS